MPVVFASWKASANGMALAVSQVVIWIVVSLVAVGLWAAGTVIAGRRAIAALRTRLIAQQEATDAERGHLSHELHDDVGQKLIALKFQLQLSQLPSASPQNMHADSLALLDDVINDVRSLSHALRPAPFDEGQLIPALTAMARTEGSRAGLCVLVDAPDDIELPRDRELACYRVAREAMNNIIKHANARHVALSVEQYPNALAVSVADDGCGFEVGPATRLAVHRGSLGLVGMHERIEHVGGTLKISSRPGGGTTVVCRVPLKVAA